MKFLVEEDSQKIVNFAQEDSHKSNWRGMASTGKNELERRGLNTKNELERHSLNTNNKLEKHGLNTKKQIGEAWPKHEKTNWRGAAPKSSMVDYRGAVDRVRLQFSTALPSEVVCRLTMIWILRKWLNYHWKFYKDYSLRFGIVC